MRANDYGICLGSISENQFQVALDRFDLGRFVHAEPIPFGFSKRNIFLTSTTGAYVFRGSPHNPRQFPSEQFFARQLHEETCVPVPWPYLFDPNKDIFGWSYVIMPMMPGIQLADPTVQQQLTTEDRHSIARAMGENLAHMQELTWPFAGEYDVKTNSIQPFETSYGDRILARIRQNLARSRTYNNSTTTDDIAWVETLIAQNQHAFEDTFQPYFVMQDYKENNVVMKCHNGQWHVSGLFDFTHAHFGNGEADLALSIALYLDENPQLVTDFIQGYTKYKPLRPGFASRFPLYMLDNRLLTWEFLQKIGKVEWDEQLTFREWVSRYISSHTLFQ